MKVTFQFRIFLCISFACSLAVLLLGWIVFCWSEDQLRVDLGQRARVQASEIAQLPELAQLITQRDIDGLAELIDPLSRKSDASYITIGDSAAIRLYHSVSPATVKQPMVGGDNDRVLKGETIISVRKGGAGVSLRSKAPVMSTDGRVIGIVSVGYLRTYMDVVSRQFLWQLITCAFVLVAVLFLISWGFSRHLKKQMFRLEPREIAALVRQNHAILEAVYEGIVVTDIQGRLISVNHAARKLFGTDQKSEDLTGQLASDIFRGDGRVFEPDASSMRTDELATLNNREVIFNRVPFSVNDDHVDGWVHSFRDQDDINILSMRLSQVTRFADNLRVLRHEQMNWTATLAGMLQMNRYEEALALIASQSEDAQSVIDHITQRIESPVISGLLMGKYAHAKERGVRLWLDPGSQLKHLPASLSEHAFISLLGNLMDNAIDATTKVTDVSRPIEVYISDINDHLIVEVSDYGCGIKDELHKSIFDRGVSSKNEENLCNTGPRHGIGLYVVQQIVKEAGGEIEISKNTPSGTVFSVFIPFS